MVRSSVDDAAKEIPALGELHHELQLVARTLINAMQGAQSVMLSVEVEGDFSTSLVPVEATHPLGFHAFDGDLLTCLAVCAVIHFTVGSFTEEPALFIDLESIALFPGL